jgi:ABC-2 type transport system permease protein
VSGNGLFLSFTGLATVVPFFLPLTVGVVSGDAVAGEAQAGTLRYLLTVRCPRAASSAVKYGALVAFALARRCSWRRRPGRRLGAVPDRRRHAAVGHDHLAARGGRRAALVALYVAALAGRARRHRPRRLDLHRGAGRRDGDDRGAGDHEPDPRRHPAAVVAAPVAVLPPVAGLRDLLRDPVPTGAIVDGLVLQAGWIAVALTIAWSRFTTRDITS